MKVAVLCGGYSMEREISLRSGERVFNALIDLGYQAEKFDLTESTLRELMMWHPDVVYIALHGKAGEDGVVQEMLEIAGLRYTGPGPLACRLTFDKSLAKEIMVKEGFATPPYVSLSEASFRDMGGAELLPQIVEKVGLPLVVKPASQGSCLGVKLVREEASLARAIISALSYGDRVVIEKYIDGTELSVSLVDGEVLPAVEVVPPRDLFDFAAMYTAGETEFYVPARLDEETARQVSEVCREVARLFAVEKLCRVDLRLDREGTPQILEINTSPGMTGTSLLPMAAEAAGLTFKQLVEKILLI